MKSLLYFVSLLALAAAECPTDWFTDGDGLCYKIFADLVTKSDASHSCESLGGSLVMIKNAFTEVSIYHQPSPTKVIWIGITCRGSDITSCNYEDGIQLTTNSYNNFAPGYPDITKGMCTYMLLQGANAGKWYNIDCNNIPFGYACQKDENSFNSCRPGYTLRNLKCYKVLSDALSYSDAEFVCRNDCADLSSILTEEENKFVMQLAQNTSDSSLFARIGPMYKRGEYCNPCGVDDLCCDPVTFSKFAHENTDLGDCVGIALTDDIVPEGYWMNTYCDKPMLSVCKTDIDMQQCVVSTTQRPQTTPSYTSCKMPLYFDGNGTVNSPPRGMGTPCKYIISVSKGYQASIVFTQFNLASDKTATIELYNDMNDKTPFQTLRYTDNPVNQVFTSQEESMKIVFNYSPNSMGTWSFNYGPKYGTPFTPTPSAKGSGCNAGLLSAPGTITSPNYPNYYPDNTSCHYQLTAGTNKKVYLSFSDVRTEQYDIIDIYDGATIDSPHIGSLSGFFPTNTNFTSTGSYMLVTFYSDGQVSFNGFAANFRAV